MAISIKRKNFLVAFAALLEAHNAEVHETTDQNGIHVTVDGEYVDEGFYDADAILARIKKD